MTYPLSHNFIRNGIIKLSRLYLIRRVYLFLFDIPYLLYNSKTDGICITVQRTNEKSSSKREKTRNLSQSNTSSLSHGQGSKNKYIINNHL